VLLACGTCALRAFTSFFIYASSLIPSSSLAFRVIIVVRRGRHRPPSNDLAHHQTLAKCSPLSPARFLRPRSLSWNGNEPSLISTAWERHAGGEGRVEPVGRLGRGQCGERRGGGWGRWEGVRVRRRFGSWFVATFCDLCNCEFVLDVMMKRVLCAVLAACCACQEPLICFDHTSTRPRDRREGSRGGQ
jgi:hypothetical protein